MDAISIGILGLRFISQLLAGQGRTRDADGVTKLADAAQAGKNVDDHMKEVAAKLQAGEHIDWDDLELRIETASARLHAGDPAPDSGDGS